MLFTWLSYACLNLKIALLYSIKDILKLHVVSPLVWPFTYGYVYMNMSIQSVTRGLAMYSRTIGSFYYFITKQRGASYGMSIDIQGSSSTCVYIVLNATKDGANCPNDNIDITQ